MEKNLGILTKLARRRNENRIKRKSRPPKKPAKEIDINAIIQPHLKRIERAGRNIMSEQRKQEGKRILKSKIRRAGKVALIDFGEEYRSLFGNTKHRKRK